MVDAKTNKPAEQQVMLHLFHHLPPGADREQDLDQAGPDQPLRRNRGATEIGVKRRELGIEARQRPIHHQPDRAQRVPRRDAH